MAPGLIAGLAQPFGWRGAFLSFGVIGVLWVIAFACFFRNTPAEHPGVNLAERAIIEEGNRDAAQPPPLSWQAMLSSPTLWFLCGMYFCSNAGWCLFITWDLKYYDKVLGLTGTSMKLASGAPLFFGGIACIVGGMTTDARKLAADVKAAGVPDVSNGQQISSALQTAFTRFEAALTTYQTQVNQLPTSSPTAFKTASSQLTTSLQQSLGGIGSGLSGLKSPQLVQAASHTPACQSLSL